MKRRDIDELEDWACPYCGRFYFMPDEELLGMRHVHLSAGNPSANEPDLPETGRLHRDSA